MENISEALIYVVTYAKYNGGSIFGKWLDLSDYSDKEEFYEACCELRKDEQDPEFMFQDWEYIPSNLIGKSWLAENIFEIIEAIDELDDDKKAVFEVWLNHGNHDITTKDITDLIRSFEDDFRGAYNDEEDYAYEIVDECYDLPEFAKTYFDYAKFARDLFMGDYWFEDGYVFRCS